MMKRNVCFEENMKKFCQEDGKYFILALDHGNGGRIALSNPGEVIKKAVDAGVDGVLTNYGVFKAFPEAFVREDGHEVGKMLRIDRLGTVLGTHYLHEQPGLRWNLEEAQKTLGINGVMCMGFPGMPDGPNGENTDELSVQLIADMVQECDRLGLVSAAEMLPRGKSNDPADRTVEAMKIACRVAAEYGADLVKTEVVGTAEEFHTVVENTYVPVLALGGVKNADVKAVFAQCKNAMDAGCKGLVVGRNIWGDANVAGMVKALKAIVHENATVEEAYAKYVG